MRQRKLPNLVTVAPMAILLFISMLTPAYSQIVLRTPSMSEGLDLSDQSTQEPSLTKRMGFSMFPDTQIIAENPRQRAAETKARFKAKAQAIEDAARFRANLLRSSLTGTTSLIVYNPSSPTTLAWLTVPSKSSIGGPTQVQQLQANDFKTGAAISIVAPYTSSPGANPQVGYFSINTGQSVVITAQNSGNTANTMDGVTVSFASPPQCPCTSGCLGPTQYVPGPNVPNGVNMAEVTLNPTGSMQQESADISCINGANTTIKMSFSGGPKWNDGAGNVSSVTNKAVGITNSPQTDSNCGISGVYPYGLSSCTTGTSLCSPTGPFCSNTAQTCELQRSANSVGFGGKVLVTFMGPLTP